MSVLIAKDALAPVELVDLFPVGQNFPMTLAFYVKVDAVSSSGVYTVDLLKAKNTAGTDSQFARFRQVDGDVWLQGGSTVGATSASTTLYQGVEPVNKWSPVVAVFTSASSRTIYSVDALGQMVTAVSTASASPTELRNLVIAEDAWSRSDYRFAYLSTYRQALTEAQAVELMQSGATDGVTPHTKWSLTAQWGADPVTSLGSNSTTLIPPVEWQYSPENPKLGANSAGVVTASNPNTVDDASLWTGLVDTVTGNPITIVEGDKALLKDPNNLGNLDCTPEGQISADTEGSFVVQIWLASEGVWGSDQTISFTVDGTAPAGSTSAGPLSVPNVNLTLTREAVVPSGEVLMVTGSGFGTRAVTYNHYTNFNDEADGTSTDALGYGINYSSLRPTVQSNDSHDGGKSLEGFYPAIGNYFPKLRRNFTPGESIYAAFWFKWTAPVGAGDVGIFKLFRTGNTGYNGEPRAVDTIRSSGNGITDSMDVSVFLEDQTLDAVGNRVNLKNANQWLFCEYWFKLSTPGVADGEYVGWVDGQESFSDRAFVTRQLPESMIDFFINMFDGRDRDAFDMTVYQSEEYASSSRARVIVTDAPIYANSTTWQIQPIASWSDTQIEYVKRQGALAAGNNYLYAWDENDNMIVDAQAVTI